MPDKLVVQRVGRAHPPGGAAKAAWREWAVDQLIRSVQGPGTVAAFTVEPYLQLAVIREGHGVLGLLVFVAHRHSAVAARELHKLIRSVAETSEMERLLIRSTARADTEHHQQQDRSSLPNLAHLWLLLRLHKRRLAGESFVKPWTHGVTAVVHRVMRVMLQTRWSAEARSVVRLEFRLAVALRGEIRRAGWFN